MLQLWSNHDVVGTTPTRRPSFCSTADNPLQPPVPIYQTQILLVFASITSKPRAEHKKKHILHVCVLTRLIPCVFRLLPVVSDCFHSQQNASAVCLEQEKDPHVLTWPNKPGSKRKSATRMHGCIFPLILQWRSGLQMHKTWLRSCINIACPLIDCLWLHVQCVKRPPAVGGKTPAWLMHAI